MQDPELRSKLLLMAFIRSLKDASGDDDKTRDGVDIKRDGNGRPAGDINEELTEEEAIAQCHLKESDAVIVMDHQTSWTLRPAFIHKILQAPLKAGIRYIGWHNQWNEELTLPNKKLRCRSDVLPAKELVSCTEGEKWLASYTQNLTKSANPLLQQAAQQAAQQIALPKHKPFGHVGFMEFCQGDTGRTFSDVILSPIDVNTTSNSSNSSSNSSNSSIASVVDTKSISMDDGIDHSSLNSNSNSNEFHCHKNSNEFHCHKNSNEFHCHKVILAYASPYFQNLFNFDSNQQHQQQHQQQHHQQTKNDQKDQKELDRLTVTLINNGVMNKTKISLNWPRGVVNRIVRYIYGGPSTLEFKNADVSEIVAMVYAADFLQMLSMFDGCMHVLTKKVDEKHFMEISKCAQDLFHHHSAIDDPFLQSIDILNHALDRFISDHPKFIRQQFFKDQTANNNYSNLTNFKI
jgi:hypothetical protein